MQEFPSKTSKRRDTPEYREHIVLSCYKKALERKVKLIEMSGGSCQECGYKRCRRALTFHHRDRNDKMFSFALNFLWSKSWDKIVEEWKKCDLLCMNCHAETEDALMDGGIIARVNAKYGTNF